MIGEKEAVNTASFSLYLVFPFFRIRWAQCALDGRGFSPGAAHFEMSIYVADHDCQRYPLGGRKTKKDAANSVSAKELDTKAGDRVGHAIAYRYSYSRLNIIQSHIQPLIIKNVDRTVAVDIYHALHVFLILDLPVIVAGRQQRIQAGHVRDIHITPF